MKYFLIFLIALFYALPAFSAGHGGTVTSPASTLGINWGSFSNTGTYTLAPGLTNYTVQSVNGNTPSINDLNSLLYHHHTRSAVDSSGRVWVAYSGCLTTESQSGMITEVNSSVNNWNTSIGPTIVIQPPSTFMAGFSNPQRISYPRAFVTYQGQLYLVSAIDGTTGACCTNETGLAFVATAMNTDGSIGTPFLINPLIYPYTPVSGFPNYTYNSTLGPPLYTLANNFGVWGGSAPGFPQSPWTGYAGTTIANGNVFVEPSTININNDGKILLRMWRCETGGTCNSNVFYMSRSLDYGNTWSVLTATNVPNSPSASAMMILADGRIAMAGNNISNDGTTGGRDPLYLALFNGQTGAVLNVYAVRQGLSGVPQYANGGNGGAQYPGISQDVNGNIWISYSIAKQVIGVTSIPASGL